MENLFNEMPISTEIPKDLFRDIQDAVGDLGEKVNRKIREGETYDLCGTLNTPIGEYLRTKGREAWSACSSHNNGNGHIYVLLHNGNQEIIIDAAAGQFIKGHNRVFVGTRQQLRSLILNPKTKIINTRSKDNPLETFERTWGNTSKEFRPMR